MIDTKAAEAQGPITLQPPMTQPPPSYNQQYPPPPGPPGPQGPLNPQQAAYPAQSPLGSNPHPMQGQPPSAAQIGADYQAALFARCAQGLHEPTTKYGPCGIITAVICFPFGLICLFMDTEQKCSRCGAKLD